MNPVAASSPLGIPDALRRLSEMEARFMRQRNLAIEQLLAGLPVPPEVLREVTQELLPQCRRAQESLAETPSSPRQAELIPPLRTYVQLHEQAWQAFASALQTGDVHQTQLHERLLVDAQRILQAGPAEEEDEPGGPPLRQFRALLLSLTPSIWVVPAIVTLNFLVWIAMILAGASLLQPGTEMMIQWGANFGPLTLHGQWWRVVTCTFLHFGLLHIGFNMYVLWQLGRLVERLVGNVGLLILYIASGVAASIASLAWNPATVSAGASGAVFGVCGAILGFIVLRRDTIPKAVLMDLKGSLITFVIYNVAFGAVVPSIDMAAHLGGLVFGVLCGLVLSQPLVPGANLRRWRRNLACLAGSAIVLPVAFSLLPVAPVDVSATVAQINRSMTTADTAEAQLTQQWEQGSIDDSAYARGLDEQVLPLLARALVDLRAVAGSPRVNPQEIEAIERFVLAKQERVRATSQDLRAGRVQKSKRPSVAPERAEATD
ncbi:MAG: rhomboid family intramembrane serine protease [Pirellulaceae bacterium]